MSLQTVWKLTQLFLGLFLGYNLPVLLEESESISMIPSPLIVSPPSAPISTSPLNLVVGVMTAAQYLDTRACSVWRTWAKDVVDQGGEVMFFVGERVTGGFWCDLPLVSLPGVGDDDYPPQRKSFLMLSWMWKHWGHRAKWFLRADDDVYVKISSLLDFLAPLDSSQPHYIGQAGRGRGQEEGRLSLEWDQNFCMGGPGVVLSKRTLALLVPNLSGCLARLVTNHEDVELGRCVARATGKTCTWAFDMQTYFYHSASTEEVRGSELVPKNVPDRVLEHAITLHPLKQASNMEAMALRLAARRRTSLRTEAMKAAQLRARVESGDLLDSNKASLAELHQLTGSWDLILGHQLYSLSAGGAKRKVPAHMAEGVTRAVSKILDVINKEASEKGRVIEFRDLFYAYVHTDPEHGITYILDLLLLYKRYKGNKMTVKVRRHVYIRQPFLSAVVKLEDTKDTPPPSLPPVMSGEGMGSPGQDGREEVNIIVPIAGEGKLEVLAKFLANYEREVLTRLQPARLIFVVFTHGDGDRLERAVREGVDALEINYPGYSFLVKILRGREFSRAVGLMYGIEQCRENQLLLLLDVDIQFTAVALNTIRSFTHQGESVYFPIVFSQFEDGGGYWRDFGFGVMSAYRSDIDRVKGLNTHISGWGKEDVDFYDRFLTTNLTVFRSVDPQLVHLYHPVVCSPALPKDQAHMCNTSKAMTYLSLETLVGKVLNSSLLTV